MAKDPTFGGEGNQEAAAGTPRPGFAGTVAAAGGAFAKASIPRVAAWCRRQWSGIAVATILLVPWVLGARAATRRAERNTQRVETRLQLLEAELQAERQGAGRLRGDLARSSGELASVRAQADAPPQAVPPMGQPAAR